jgi:hypothetical protein
MAMPPLPTTIDATTLWLSNTYVGSAMKTSAWLWPICETLHFIGLTLVIGIAGLLDLRLMGIYRRVSLAAVMDMSRWAAAGVMINLVTGSLFLIGAADQYVYNTAWWWKVAFLCVAAINIAVFELRRDTKSIALTIGPGDDTPLRFKVAGGVSLLSWFAVLYFGRMLPFIGNAF